MSTPMEILMRWSGGPVLPVILVPAEKLCVGVNQADHLAHAEPSLTPPLQNTDPTVLSCLYVTCMSYLQALQFHKGFWDGWLVNHVPTLFLQEQGGDSWSGSLPISDLQTPEIDMPKKIAGKKFLREMLLFKHSLSVTKKWIVKLK